MSKALAAATPARKKRLDSYFTTFVHGILCCYVAHQVSTPMGRHARTTPSPS